MTQEEKQMLLKDLCARLPYETWVQYEGKEWLVTGYGHGRVSLLPSAFSSVGGPCPLVEEVRPYLRPMSSMTEEELKWYYNKLTIIEESRIRRQKHIEELNDWLLSHYFDYRGLIEKGLALKASNNMYKTE